MEIKVQKSFYDYRILVYDYWASNGKRYFYKVYADELCDVVLYKYYSMHSQRKEKFQRKEKKSFKEKRRKVSRKERKVSRKEKKKEQYSFQEKKKRKVL